MSGKNSRILILLCTAMICFLLLLSQLETFFTVRTFHQLTDRLFHEEVTSSTLTLHYTLQNPESFGITDVPVQYAALNSEDSQALSNLQILRKLDTSRLSEEDQITGDILLLLLNQADLSGTFSQYAEPLGATIGIQAQLPILLCEYAFDTADDIHTYLSLLADTDQYFSSLLAYERQKAVSGLFMSDSCADGVISQCLSFAESDPDSHLLVTAFNRKLQNISFLSDMQKQELQKQNLKLVNEHVIPAYRLLANGLKDLKKYCCNQMGLYYLPKGKAYYEYLVQHSTGSILSVDSIQNRIQKQLIRDISFCQTLLRQYPNLEETAIEGIPSDPETILAELQEKMKPDFPVSPKTSYALKYVDTSLSSYLSPAFYLTSPVDNPDRNIIYLNPDTKCSSLDLYTTLAHEGYPGHLYQNLTSGAGLSPLRSLLNFGGYTEGWATYVEMISYSYAAEGKSDREHAAILLAQKQRSIMLGLSSFLDICIHYRGFSPEDTRQFLERLGITSSSTASSLYEAVLESPANYLKYYLGYLTFLDLRIYCQKQWPDQFQLSDFHRRILEIGPCQFPVLEKYLKASYE